jgi:predicted metal-dependent hydrolase
VRNKPVKQLFQIGKIEDVLFERSPRAKRINITVRPFKGVRVAVPYGISLKKARAFAESNHSWIQRQLEKAAQSEKDHLRLSDCFKNIDRRAARRILVQRLDDLAMRHGYRYHRVSVRNQKTRWGSCSAKNNISLNMKLTRLPEYLMDYVILHELVHTRFKNHGQLFYAELDRLVNNRKEMDKLLKVYGAGLL